MSQQKAREIAGRILKELGQGGLAFAGMQLENARRAGDATGVDIWREVTQILAKYEDAPAAAPAVHGSSDLWRAMQKVELCRHRAMKLEGAAANVAEPLRRDALDLAMQWRDLALQVELLISQANLWKT